MDTFGIMGIACAFVTWGLIIKLRKEFEELKKNLEDSGVLKGQTESGDK